MALVVTAALVLGAGAVAADPAPAVAAGAPSEVATPVSAAGPDPSLSVAGEVVSGADPRTQAPTLHVPGTVQLPADRSRFRTPEARDTPLYAAKMKGLVGTDPNLVPTITIGAVRRGDLDGDGPDDLATLVKGEAQGRSLGFLAVTYGVGDGRFSEPAFFPLGPDATTRTAPVDVVLADVDGDDALDAVASSAGNGANLGFLSLLRNAGDGTFLAPEIDLAAVPDPGYIDVGSWGGDADVQLAVISRADQRAYAIDVTVDGFENLTPDGVVLQQTNQTRYGTAAADGDDDGVDELYIAQNSNGSGGATGIQVVSDLVSDTPTTGWLPDAATPTYRITAGDFDDDGLDDLAVVDHRFAGVAPGGTIRQVVRQRVLALPGRDPGAAPFPDGSDLDMIPAWHSSCPTASAGAMPASDVDGDGHLDLVLHQCTGGDELDFVMVARGDGTGAFERTYWVSTPGSRPTSGPGIKRTLAGITVLDADGDGAPEVAWSGTAGQEGTGVFVLEGDPEHPGELLAAPLPDQGAPVDRTSAFKGEQVAIADWDDDGQDDMVVLRDGDVVWRPGDGTGRFGEPQPVTARGAWCTAGIGTMAVGDIDEDGHLDIVCRSQLQVGVAWGAGAGQPVDPVNLGALSWTGFQNTDIVDLDADGRRDVVITASYSGEAQVLVWFQGADRAWPASPATRDLGWASTTAIGDVDEDGEPEVVAQVPIRGGADVYRIALIRGDGEGGLVETLDEPYGDHRFGTTYASGLADLDGDGNLDWVGSHIGSFSQGYPRYLVVRLGDGEGHFETSTSKVVGPLPINWDGGAFQRGGLRLAIGDMDGDGNRDLVYPTYGVGVEILPGNGDGTFDLAAVGRWSAGSHPGIVTLADLDGDGRTDVVAGTNFSQSAGGYGFAPRPALSHAIVLNDSG
ncbi:MAG TPA: VCBS repeat-containing protein, partial [Iamia sp.]|nr:VCBS repeat-containing protein [Iamia sp.]